ncbi:hypothetical protein M758_12G136000 [Ceratodon purpureus]|uniref:Uncharacterized protein n=1 Tax=Ceratodon purpureus TaxID=3225 RepID=A0A8T0G9B9_CERPU|nr:hypothetical protein KC19_12G132800 [Ceratodon purpureus]KAG0599211.1 hypothetical protein M758_12G136000 [Ceratodon purpureus]
MPFGAMILLCSSIGSGTVVVHCGSLLLGRACSGGGAFLSWFCTSKHKLGP